MYNHGSGTFVVINDKKRGAWSFRGSRVGSLSRWYIKSKNNGVESAFDRSTKQVAIGNAGFKAMSFRLVQSFLLYGLRRIKSFVFVLFLSGCFFYFSFARLFR